MWFSAGVTYAGPIQANLTPHLKWPPVLKKAWPQSNLTPHIVHRGDHVWGKAPSRVTPFHFLHLPRKAGIVCVYCEVSEGCAGPSSKVTPTFLHFHTCDDNQGWVGVEGKISIYILHALREHISHRLSTPHLPKLCVHIYNSAKCAYESKDSQFP